MIEMKWEAFCGEEEFQNFKVNKISAGKTRKTVLNTLNSQSIKFSALGVSL